MKRYRILMIIFWRKTWSIWTSLSWKNFEKWNFSRKFEMKEIYSKEDIRHFFLPREGIMHSYVVETEDKITDFISFYTLPSSITQNSNKTDINVIHPQSVYSDPKNLILSSNNLISSISQIRLRTHITSSPESTISKHCSKLAWFSQTSLAVMSSTLLKLWRTTKSSRYWF